MLSICTGLLVVFHIQSNATPGLVPKPHPLPPTLAQSQDDSNRSDYFSQVKTTAVGYLVWSQFPVRVYIEQSAEGSATELQKWVQALLQAVQEWDGYIPLEVVSRQEGADINILPLAPRLQASPNGKLARARSAETSYELYVRSTSTSSVLAHRCTILLNPSQTSQYLQASARHELGHALGIWGHSPVATDALYFSQVRNPPPISARDINTLKKVYQQPTCLGWPLSQPSPAVAPKLGDKVVLTD